MDVGNRFDDSVLDSRILKLTDMIRMKTKKLKTAFILDWNVYFIAK